MEKILLSTSTKENGCYYHFARNFNALFVSKHLGGQMVYECSLPEENIIADYLVASITAYADKLFFAPMLAKKIWIYMLKEKKWMSISIDIFGEIDKRVNKIGGSIIYKEYVIFLGYSIPYIIKLNMNTLKYSVIDLSNIIKDKADEYMFRSAEIVNDVLYTPFLSGNNIIKVNLETEKAELIDVGEKGECFIGLKRVGNEFWLSPKKGNRYGKVGFDGGQIFWNLPQAIRKSKDNMFNGLDKIGNLIYFPSSSGRTFAVNPCSPNEYNILEWYIEYICEISEEVFVHMKNGDSYVVGDDGKLEKIFLTLDSNDMNKIFKKAIKTDKTVSESRYLNLKDLLSIV